MLNSLTYTTIKRDRSMSCVYDVKKRRGIIE